MSNMTVSKLSFFNDLNLMSYLPPHIVNDANGDLTLRLYDTVDKSYSFLSASGKKSVTGRIVAYMKVSRKVLIENSEAFKSEFVG